MQQYQHEPLETAEVDKIFSGLNFGIDAETWLSGRDTFFNQDEPMRARTKFALGHYLFFGDPTCSLPALGSGSDKEREWVIKQILLNATHWSMSHPRFMRENGAKEQANAFL